MYGLGHLNKCRRLMGSDVSKCGAVVDLWALMSQRVEVSSIDGLGCFTMWKSGNLNGDFCAWPGRSELEIGQSQL